MNWPVGLGFCDYNNIEDWWDTKAMAFWDQGDPPGLSSAAARYPLVGNRVRGCLASQWDYEAAPVL